MDGGPFRTGRPVERRAASRPASAHRQPEEPQPMAAEAPKPIHRAAPARPMEKDEKSGKRFVWPIIVAAIVILGAVGWFAWSNMRGGGLAIDGSKYQAVFFTNGQVYFGKLQSSGDEYLKLTDIYYLQTQTGESDSKNPQQTSSDQNNVQLIKLGDEVHGPEDEMIISKDQLLFYENLKADGKVAQSIEKHKSSK